MSRALVLGGGGVTGIAWETGALAGLREAGIDVANWDLVVGTSAGSVVAARLLGGIDLEAAFAAQVLDDTSVEDVHVRTLAGPVGSRMLIVGRRPRFAWLPRLWLSATAIETLVRHAARRRLRRVSRIPPEAGPGPRLISEPDPVLERMGAFALAARTAPEASFLEIVAAILGPVVDWPRGLEVTAVDALSGAVVVFDETSGVPLARAVAASSSVPSIFPPVWIGGRPYVDGGVASQTHLGLAGAHDELLVLAPLDLGRLEAEAQAVRDAGRRVHLVTPPAATRRLLGRHVALLDPARRSRSATAGRADGRAAAEQILRRDGEAHRARDEGSAA